tara:strand:- start:2460 stop:3203 length:744 start_codon:yes stop_codon:yes gene_type:complete
MIVISPAKRLTSNSSDSSLPTTVPAFKKEADLLAKQLSKMNIAELGSMMKVSESIAELNNLRYKNWDKNIGTEKRAIFQFEGDVFKHLSAQDLTENEINYMNDKLRILSGIYGLLKPSDHMNPYRLEMGTKHNFNGAANLYEFWGDKIAKRLMQELGDDLLFNLASEEYFASVSKHLSKEKVINFKFLTKTNNKERVVGVIAKRARGEMAKFLIQNKVESTDKIEKFSAMNFKFRSFENNCFTFVSS